MERERGAAALWGHRHLPLLARARSKESVEYVLQALWRTRRTGLDAADRAVARDVLQLSDDAELDPVRTTRFPGVSRYQSISSFLYYFLRCCPRRGCCKLDPQPCASSTSLLQLLVCLRILIWRCVNENVAKDDVPKLFPEEVPPELQKLLTLLLQKFQPEWQEDASKDQASKLRLETAECQLNQNGDTSEQPAAATAKLQNGTAPAKDSVESGEKEVKKFPLAKDSLDKMLEDMFSIKDQMPNAVNDKGHEEIAGRT
ncbi:uncharacterized protein LOC133895555 isoform X1 [Phragmites australis]|uniref:uncharacterized protein LOC133895555 isoform X1 n=1 Tax=Phragmites australis TaxID=29695 RepID=UPI002D790F2B|nr:uncharacterized protein LOC133895555 isoform X1 [Phragmites australis]